MSLLFSCSSARPNSWATNRILMVPSSFWEETDVNIVDAWSRALCCIYIWVEEEADASIATAALTTYVGEVRLYPDATDFVSAASSALVDTCNNMSMGSVDCYSQRECVDNALEDLEPAVEMSSITTGTELKLEISNASDGNGGITCLDASRIIFLSLLLLACILKIHH